MNKKEEQLLKEIVDYAEEHKIMPTRRYLQNKMNYRSVNSITQYLKSLEKENYLKRDDQGKLILSKYAPYYDDKLKNIKIINKKCSFVQLIIDKRKKYFAYRINNDYFNNIGILRNDILIVEQKKELKSNDLGLFIIDEKYRIMKYNYKDGFYILNDCEEILLNKVKIIGKVIMIERKL